MVRVGAVHLGWDVVSVAAGGSGVPIRPVQVEGSYNPPAYLLADASGKLFTAGAGRQRPDLGMAIPDVREILGHPQIVIAGATWPAELVFRARLYNPLAAIGSHLRGKPDVVALPYPDDWPEPKIEAYARLVEQLDVEVEPIPESIALSGYVRALGLVRAPDHRLPDGLGATAVHFDGQVVDGRADILVVAVHGDEERPTESVYVPIDPESTRDPRVADDTVIEVMAAARAIGADNSTVLLAGQVVFNETLRFAFRNHLGQRLKKAEHPMHALVLGATHLLVSENEDDEEEDPGPYPHPAPPTGGGGPNYAAPSRRDESGPARNPAPAPTQNPSAGGRGPHPSAGPDRAMTNPPVPPPARPGQEPPRPGQFRPGDARGELPPPISGPPGRFNRAPDPHTGSQPAPQSPPVGQPGPRPHPAGPADGGSRPEAEPDDDRGKGKIWNKMKDNLFGAHAVVGLAALVAAATWAAGGAGTAQAHPGPAGVVVRSVTQSPEAAAVSHSAAACVPMPRVLVEPPAAAGPGTELPGQPLYAREPAPEAGESGQAPESSEPGAGECGRSGIDTLRYLVPGLPGVTDPGPPIDI
ncbi:hypothetical protein [Nocardia sp. NPDC019395]|uniref:hypothetical protein n=1 Tax=Nocardia sp. NPDC019395 TaxID=3154686 RepID=UPI0033D829D5